MGCVPVPNGNAKKRMLISPVPVNIDKLCEV